MLNFLGIGAQKSGTTWLYHHLARDPEIRFPGGKEIHFWDRYRPPGAKGPHPELVRQVERQPLRMDQYLALFQSKEGIKGEITPSYALLETEVITEIARLNPALRIIYLIRNPVERAWSAALHALDRADLEYHEASDQWFLDHFHSSGSLGRGDYEGCLKRWRGVFPEEQILLELHDSLRDNPKELLRRCALHLGSSASFLEQTDPDDLKQPVYAGKRHPIRSALVPRLNAIYQPQIERLARYINQDISHWQAASLST